MTATVPAWGIGCFMRLVTKLLLCETQDVLIDVRCL